MIPETGKQDKPIQIHNGTSLTHEEKLRALLPCPQKYVEDYELRGDDGDYAPNEHEQFLMKDCLIGYEEDIFNALKSKVILREELLTEQEICDVVSRDGFYLDREHKYSENHKCVHCDIARSMVKAQNKKAGL